MNKDKVLNKEENNVTIYLPKDTYFNSVKIDTKTGKTLIESLNAKDVSLDIGAGELNILSGNIENLECDTGVGKINITSKILSGAKIDTGIGELTLNVIGKKEDYTIKTNNGIGDVRLDGTSISKNTQLGDGKKLVDLDSDIGQINVNFINQ